MSKTSLWLEWARELKAIGQIGLAYSENEFDKERYHRIEEIAADITAKHTTLPQKEIIDNFKMEPGYATPKIDVRGAVIHENKILLVQERADHKWAMPGGWADVGDTPKSVVTREVYEESGYLVTPEKVIAVLDANRDAEYMNFYHAFKIIFMCKLEGGTARASHETLAVDFFDPDDLPPLSTDRTHANHIREIKKHLQDPNRLTTFD